MMSKISSWFSWMRQHKVMAVFIVVGIMALGIFIRQRFLTPTSSPQYQTEQLAKTTLVASVSGSGQVTTSNSTSLNTSATGVVRQVLVKEGETVKAGQKIATVDLDLAGKQKAVQALATYQKAKNQVTSAQADQYTQQSKMFVANQKFMNSAVAGGKATSDPDWVEQNADWLASELSYKNQANVINANQTDVQQAWLSYQQSSDIIVAPIGGKIVGLTLQPGMVLANSSSGSSSTTASETKVGSIVTTALPLIKVTLTEIDISKIHVGDKATITADAIADKTFVGKVVSIDTVGQVSSNVTSYPVYIQLSSATPELLSNMAVTANIITATKADVLAVPNSAIVTTNGTSQVRVMNNGQVSLSEVQTGLTTDTQTEVTAGLSEGQIIVTSVSAGATSTTATGQSAFSSLGRGGLSTFTSSGRSGTGTRTGGATQVIMRAP